MILSFAKTKQNSKHYLKCFLTTTFTHQNAFTVWSSAHANKKAQDAITKHDKSLYWGNAVTVEFEIQWKNLIHSYGNRTLGVGGPKFNR